MMLLSSSLSLKPHFFHQRQTTFSHLHPIISTHSLPIYNTNSPPPKPSLTTRTRVCHHRAPKPQTPPEEEELMKGPSDGSSKVMLLGAVSLGLALFLVGIDGKEALALGPDGPLVEEFWDNMRRYGLYIVTVSTGVVYTILQPIIELLKNPISAILIITILAGSAYILSQVLSLMVGVSEFAYDYAS